METPYKRYFLLFGNTTTANQLKIAYNKILLEFKPHIHLNKVKRFLEVLELAYDILSNDELKLLYDEYCSKHHISSGSYYYFYDGILDSILERDFSFMNVIKACYDNAAKHDKASKFRNFMRGSSIYQRGIFIPLNDIFDSVYTKIEKEHRQREYEENKGKQEEERRKQQEEKRRLEREREERRVQEARRWLEREREKRERRERRKNTLKEFSPVFAIILVTISVMAYSKFKEHEEISKAATDIQTALRDFDAYFKSKNTILVPVSMTNVTLPVKVYDDVCFSAISDPKNLNIKVNTGDSKICSKVWMNDINMKNLHQKLVENNKTIQYEAVKQTAKKQTTTKKKTTTKKRTTSRRSSARYR